MNLAQANTNIETITGSTGTLPKNLEALIEGVQDTYSVIDQKGGTLPQQKNTNNLPDAIGSI